MKYFGRLCVALLVAGCAGTGGVLETSGTQSLGDDAVALVKVPNALSLLAVDGKKVDPAVGTVGYDVRLLPGTRRLRFAYEENWGNPSTYDWVYSKHVVEVVLEARAGVTYTAGYPEPGNVIEARDLASDLRVWIDDPVGGRATSKKVAEHGSPGSRLFSGGSTDIGEEAEAAGADTSTVSAVGGSGVVVPSAGIIAAGAGTAGDSAEGATAQQSQQDPLQRLKIWWKLASEEDRRAFQAWVETQ